MRGFKVVPAFALAVAMTVLAPGATATPLLPSGLSATSDAAGLHLASSSPLAGALLEHRADRDVVPLGAVPGTSHDAPLVPAAPAPYAVAAVHLEGEGVPAFLLVPAGQDCSGEVLVASSSAVATLLCGPWPPPSPLLNAIGVRQPVVQNCGIVGVGLDASFPYVRIGIRDECLPV